MPHSHVKPWFQYYLSSLCQLVTYAKKLKFAQTYDWRDRGMLTMLAAATATNGTNLCTRGGALYQHTQPEDYDDAQKHGTLKKKKKKKNTTKGKETIMKLLKKNPEKSKTGNR
jgi:hypothetical protein